MSTYKIVADETELRRFIDWLPELTEDEKFYCSLFARKKYCPELVKSNDKTQLKRFTSNKERLIQKLYNLEVREGNYFLKGTQQVPQRALVAYINPNPRNMRTATFDAISKLAHMLKTNNRGFNAHAEVLSCIQRAKSRTCYVDFDFDFKDDKIIDKCIDIVGEDALTVIETRGGYHMMIKPSLANNRKTWYQSLMKLGADQAGDQMVPIVGCVQGGFVPKFIDI
jgi:hypothetical protein